jgi:DNA-binding MarR family transcriptional regulator
MGDTFMDPNTLIRDLEIFSKISPDMQVSTLLVFLYIARNGKCYQKDIERELGLSNASASRNISYWTKHKSKDAEGVGFVERVDDVMDRRNKVVQLTPNGRLFYNRLRELGNGKTQG